MIPIRDVNPTSIRPLLTLLIIAVNAVVYFGVQPQPPESGEAAEFLYRHAAIPCELTTGDALDPREISTGSCTEGGVSVFEDKVLPLSILVSMFLHGSLVHILFNMWSLWIFGNNVEEAFGRLGFVLLYLASGIAATLGFVLANPELSVPLVGASGAIAGVMGAYLVLFPRHQIMTLVFVWIVAIPAVAFLGLWFFSQFSIGPGEIAWEAHVAGFAFGALVTLPFRRRLLENTLTGREEAGIGY